jgi:hypothetical protein
VMVNRVCAASGVGRLRASARIMLIAFRIMSGLIPEKPY